MVSLLGLMDSAKEGSTFPENAHNFFYQSPRRNISEDLNLQQHRCDNFISLFTVLLFPSRKASHFTQVPARFEIMSTSKQTQLVPLIIDHTWPAFTTSRGNA